MSSLFKTIYLIFICILIQLLNAQIIGYEFTDLPSPRLINSEMNPLGIGDRYGTEGCISSNGLWLGITWSGYSNSIGKVEIWSLIDPTKDDKNKWEKVFDIDTFTDSSNNDQFGSQCWFNNDGTQIFIGSPNENINGAIYIFNRNSNILPSPNNANEIRTNTKFTQSSKFIPPSNTPTVTSFGQGEFIAHNSIFVIADDETTNSDGGLLFIYTKQGAGWVYDQTISTGDTGTGFIARVSIGGKSSFELIASPSPSSSNVQIFKRSVDNNNSNNFNLIQTITLTGGSFGSSVFFATDNTIDYPRLIIGDRDRNVNGFTSIGQAYVYDWSTTNNQYQLSFPIFDDTNIPIAINSNDGCGHEVRLNSDGSKGLISCFLSEGENNDMNVNYGSILLLDLPTIEDLNDESNSNDNVLITNILSDETTIGGDGQRFGSRTSTDLSLTQIFSGSILGNNLGKWSFFQTSNFSPISSSENSNFFSNLFSQLWFQITLISISILIILVLSTIIYSKSSLFQPKTSSIRIKENYSTFKEKEKEKGKEKGKDFDSISNSTTFSAYTGLTRAMPELDFKKGSSRRESRKSSSSRRESVNSNSNNYNMKGRKKSHSTTKKEKIKKDKKDKKDKKEKQRISDVSNLSSFTLLKNGDKVKEGNSIATKKMIVAEQEIELGIKVGEGEGNNNDTRFTLNPKQPINNTLTPNKMNKH